VKICLSGVIWGSPPELTDEEIETMREFIMHRIMEEKGQCLN
jgi:hypothetical protein